MKLMKKEYINCPHCGTVTISNNVASNLNGINQHGLETAEIFHAIIFLESHIVAREQSKM